jgi:hypothetical protein
MQTTSLLGREFVNLTPHTINVINADGSTQSFPPSGIVARVEVEREKIDSHFGVDIFAAETGLVTGIDDFRMKGGREYVIITSLAVKTPLRDYLQDIIDNDGYEEGDNPGFVVVSPGELVRNAEGQPIGCKGLDL